MQEITTGRELVAELARIRRYTGRKIDQFEELIMNFNNPVEPGFWEARQALMLTQRYFTDLTETYNKIVRDLNLEYKL